MTTLSLDQLGKLSKGNCPACGNRGFVIGPQGGKSTNIECANGCRARFSVAFYSGAALMGEALPPGGPVWPSEPAQ